MKRYTLYNNIFGWLSFVIAAVTYILTIESTTSFWDCGEFITTAFKLEVGHPPGAPLFMIFGRIFTLFAGGDVTKVPVMINIMSALASAFTILFLFWSITHIAKKIVLNNSKSQTSELTEGQVLAVIGSGLVGALAYTFSDTFWFSAVEGEVYGSSSFFTAIVFWAILKWENVANEKFANRWIILIAYLMGLSIGVHLLNLLAIPAIVFVYYFKKYKITRNGVLATGALSVALLGGIMYVVIPGIPKVATWFELLFVNSFGMKYNTGVLVYVLLLVSALIWGLYFTYKQKHVVINTILTVLVVIIIGYSSFAMIVIRSAADTPMDQNSPDNVFTLISYLNRDQYGDNPLIYGQYFNSKPVDYKDGAPTYTQQNGKYVITDKKVERVYEAAAKTIFPRMWSDQENHAVGYKKWAKLPDDDEKKPTFSENLKYFFRYQVNYMYIRYFLWNFVGRQNDIQGTEGEVNSGNWISGISFIDDARLGPQDKLPDEYKNNWAKNKYYFLPLILGLLGLVFLYQKDKKDFWIVIMLFFFTGLAIVLYLNQPPYQPRERDYAYAGSFYAYAIFIGLGVLALFTWLQKLYKDSKVISIVAATGVTTVCLFAVPTLMAKENWNDHDRSGRYTARDFASNYLESCEKNAILFTNGDNDTFPLWYAQEVENIRTDVRVINLSYLNTDWYIDQMKRRAYLSAPVPFSMTKEKYINGKRDLVYLYDKISTYTNLREVIDFIASDDPQSKMNQQGTEFAYSPTKKFYVPVDSALVLKNGTVSPNDADKIVKSLNWEMKSRYVRKNELMVLDLLATFRWQRPIYFAITVGPSNYVQLDNYFQLEGLAYRVVPIKTNSTDGQTGRVATDVMYRNMMHKFKWGGIDKPNVYLDENNRRMILNIRNNFARLANTMIAEGKRDSAVKALDFCFTLLPNSRLPYNYYSLLAANAYYKAGETKKGNEVIEQVAINTEQEWNYYMSLDSDDMLQFQQDIERTSYVMKEILNITSNFKQTELYDKLEKRFLSSMKQMQGN